ncbi:hypothetical protein U9M48_002148 [Paspalum notatum var. saurae]|uniref:DUF4218 domain-containing protein n=1 Tax=Paspalum notatum var. saurae TaxID=547442 RepID=A0AAQ3PJ19_PASNO
MGHWSSDGKYTTDYSSLDSEEVRQLSPKRRWRWEEEDDDFWGWPPEEEEDDNDERDWKKLERMLEDHRTLLYPDCKEGHMKLRSTLELLQWKASNEVASGGQQIACNNIGRKRGLEVQKIYAYPNDCILYRGDYHELESCPVCKATRYKIKRDDPRDIEGEPPRKRVPAKVMWYFPIIPRLRRLFRNTAHAKIIRWYKEERKKDDMLRHPADGSQWRKIDRTYPDFAEDARNIRFGLSTDGLNPFSEMSSIHSTWPVTLCMYNLPPWLCLKQKFIMMPALIQGPKQPGVRVWDAHKQEAFDLRALLLVTINDWPTLTNLSGQSNKGFRACVHCLDETDNTFLKHCRKVVYVGGHRRLLGGKHPVRKKGKHFNGKEENRGKLIHRSGKVVFEMVKSLRVVFGKGPGSVPIPNENGKAPMWKKKSIFWDLPYWEVLDVRHAIDVMHVTKNLCVNLLGFLRTYGKNKDTLEAREDMAALKGEQGHHYLSTASYTLSKREKESMFECLDCIKVPSGYSSNVRRIIKYKDKKFVNSKSHDCHVLMTQLLPVVLRGILPENVRKTITKLCAFLNAISQKVIHLDNLTSLQNDVVQCLVSLELIFPPSFYDIMTHLLVHIVKEIGILGPVFLQNMFPFERYMVVLKKYVRNRSRPEGCIAKGYETEEVIEFCTDYIDELKPIGVPLSRYEGR